MLWSPIVDDIEINKLLTQHWLECLVESGKYTLTLKQKYIYMGEFNLKIKQKYHIEKIYPKI